MESQEKAEFASTTGISLMGFRLDKVQYYNEEELNKFKRYCEKVGIFIEISETDNRLSLLIDHPIYEKIVSRNAGKRAQYVYSSKYTYGEIRYWKGCGEKVDDICKKIGCSRETFFRQMRKAKEESYPDEKPFVAIWENSVEKERMDQRYFTKDKK